MDQEVGVRRDLLARACLGKMSCGPSEAEIFLSYSAVMAEKGMREPLNSGLMAMMCVDWCKARG